MSVVRRARTLLLLLALAVAGLLAPPLVPGASAAVPAVQLSLVEAHGPGGDPFVGEVFVAQSQPYDVGLGRVGWTCAVDLGNGPVTGFWRAPTSVPSAPCAGVTSYDAPGTYAITMTVTDPTGASATATRVVHVVPRPVTAVAAGVEGTAVTLHGTSPAGSSYRWSFLDDPTERCRLDDPTALDVTVRCADEGTYRVAFDAGVGGTSRAFALTYTNGAPAPTVVLGRTDASGALVAATRVGTGDDVILAVDTHDPSFLALPGFDSPTGDALTCRAVLGNGTTQTQAAQPFDGTCGFTTTYLKAGPVTVTVVVTDDSGASARVTRRLTVVRRDVLVTAQGTTPDGTRARLSASITPAGVAGAVRITTSQGATVVLQRVETIGLSLGGTDLLLSGPATLNGARGYHLSVGVTRRGRVALRVTLSEVLPDGSTSAVADGEGLRPAFTTVFRAAAVA